ncbi:Sporulation protein RMD1 [Choanephora cucurbitarum]|uniref:Sporulation protein RMD1 n=1 Tax=Choanephora cucurbitarum TaxID=101091 RepID=A0A1C7NK35_9FUNG|nr:Sporulation protein RMD1 [Choanephora cucurbitarum]
MSNKPIENPSKKSSKPSAISKQVLKTNPIPQAVQPSDSTPKVITPTPNTLPVLKGKQPTQPLRSTKVSQKLVLFPQADDPETNMKSTLPIESTTHLEQDHEVYDDTFDPYLDEIRRVSLGEQQWQDEQSQPRTAGVPLPIEWTFGSRTPAERMTKDERESAMLPRAAAYYTGEGYDLTRLRPFLRQHHRVAPRLYDECLYAAYHFPLKTLRPDKDNLYNIRVQSRTPNHDSNVMDEEEMDYDEDHLHRALETPTVIQPRPGQPFPEYFNKEEENGKHDTTQPYYSTTDRIPSPDKQHDSFNSTDNATTVVDDNLNDTAAMVVREPFKGGEVFIFDYGVVVFWNFRRAEELLMLEDLMKFSVEPFRDNPDEDMQIEEIHFQYDTSQMKPRIFNDMITLKSGNHMIKLTLSHGLSQSAVVARYEDIMDKTIEETKHLPKEMAETGRLGKNRTEITKINGQLFTLRMNVNLVSNVLDTPEIFWSEPALQPMYTAIREYLEIPQRAQILNDRLRVISDLLSMLRDHLTNFGVEYQTLIIIYLIIVAVIVACFEIAVKILHSVDLF